MEGLSPPSGAFHFFGCQTLGLTPQAKHLPPLRGFRPRLGVIASDALLSFVILSEAVRRPSRRIPRSRRQPTLSTLRRSRGIPRLRRRFAPPPLGMTKGGWRRFVVRPSRPHFIDGSGIVRAGRPHHKSIEQSFAGPELAIWATAFLRRVMCSEHSPASGDPSTTASLRSTFARDDKGGWRRFRSTFARDDKRGWRRFVVRPSRPHFIDGSGIVRAGRPHHKSIEQSFAGPELAIWATAFLRRVMCSEHSPASGDPSTTASLRSTSARDDKRGMASLRSTTARDDKRGMASLRSTFARDDKRGMAFASLHIRSG